MVFKGARSAPPAFLFTVETRLRNDPMFVFRVGGKPFPSFVQATFVCFRAMAAACEDRLFAVVLRLRCRPRTHAMNPESRVNLSGSVETFLTLLASPPIAVVMRTAPAPRLLLSPPCMHKPVVSGAKHNCPVSIWHNWSTFCEWNHVMNVQRTQAVARQVRKGTLSVVCENARAVVPPGLRVVDSRHW